VLSTCKPIKRKFVVTRNVVDGGMLIYEIAITQGEATGGIAVDKYNINPYY
jgi:hypothetical protein